MSELDKRPDWTNDRNARVWETLANMYGERFVRAYGDYPPKIWAQLINRMSDDQIKQSLAMLGKHYPHPPSMPEFYSAGKTPGVRFAGGNPQLTHERPKLSKWGVLGNRVFMRHMLRSGGMGERLAPMLKVKNDFVRDQEKFQSEGEPLPQPEFVKMLDTMLSDKWKELNSARAAAED